SAKYSCSGSALILVKGRTATEGLSGNVREGCTTPFDAAAISSPQTLKTRTDRAMFFRERLNKRVEAWIWAWRSLSLEGKRGNSATLKPHFGVCAVAGLIAKTLRRLTAQQVPARHEQIGQCASDQQTMEVLVQPAIAHLGKAEHPFDDPDRVFDAGSHFGL